MGVTLLVVLFIPGQQDIAVKITDYQNLGSVIMSETV